MQTTNDVRAKFLSYFGSQGHAVVESSPLVPRNDPTLLFTSAGMVQFKNLFTGTEKRDYVRATTSQKCLRAGGKHNDLENVGYTARHHTFFEMLGNFSFGDYFKERAIELAWTTVTREFGLDPKRLLVTVYHDDDEAHGLWKKIAGLTDDKIIRIATSDNFWSAGDTGPCGPCSEIFFDHGAKVWGGPPGSAEQDGDRFIEIWNLVFMQFEQQADGSRLPLPRPSIDTGMGLERVTAVLQGKHDNYDIDLMRALIEASAQAASSDPDGPHKVSHRVIADHLRASCFLMADGVLPSNEGRGYVLRRIMRRAMRHAHLIGCRDPHLWRLVPALQKQMGDHYPELNRAGALMTETLKLEETRFKAMLDRGLKLLEDETSKLGDGQALAGDVAFTLYDTYGFPLDLTQDVLRGQGRTVDTLGFEQAMQAQREKARAAWSGSGEAATDKLWFDLRHQHGATDFLGYATDSAEAQVLAIVADGAPVTTAAAGTQVAVIVNQTPFYGESGGQQGDQGMIQTLAGGLVRVTDTQKRVGDLWVHLGVVAAGSLAVGDGVTATVDAARRNQIRANHSATHLLHEALRRRLGDHVTQKGSLVAAERLRFDISHPKPLTADEVQDVEREVNARIRLNTPVGTRLMTPDDAIAEGAMALFGEKYGDEVRVVTMGGDSTRFSVELCGGTHVRSTGDIGAFKILGESAVAAGVRRLEAITGQAVLDYLAQQEATLSAAAGTLKTTVAEVPARVAALVEERRRLERELLDARKALATGGSQGAAAVETLAGVSFIARRADGVPARELKGMVDQLKQDLTDGIVVVAAADEAGKVSLVIGVTEALSQRVSAVDLVRVGAEALGGKGGGGRPDMAQAGGADAALIDAAFAAVREKVGALATA
ncbi:alanine--tRNA ligase [Elstera cyanobacteriorum]|uniref:Alanine--tRNA ligase n=1 Tax=Elstera cyanobacteriorum TaxID=2022747 RepID=A0A255XQK7_9PROT|nr:alanine--tRNA ligase [Elstera cyanobacteriorum]OYQ18725.1 alanine--tRNA ligase [Elstera cyanobacteriorum]GFZ78140.1 alanine--tRNA ligase [Elstera cyanobacteriorum]